MRHLSANWALKICVNFVVCTKIAYIYCEFTHIFRQFFVCQTPFCVALQVWAQFCHQKRESRVKILCTKFAIRVKFSAKFLVQWSSKEFSFLILAIFVQFLVLSKFAFRSNKFSFYAFKFISIIPKILNGKFLATHLNFCAPI